MKEAKDIALTFLYLAIAISTIIFTVNYAFVDWNAVSNEFGETIEEIAELIDCRIEYCGFVYDGICSDNDAIFEFLNNMTCDSYYAPEQKPIEFSVPDDYWEKYLDSLPKYINYTVCPECPKCVYDWGIYWYNTTNPIEWQYVNTRYKK